jgi:hypothetical protein
MHSSRGGGKFTQSELHPRSDMSILVIEHYSYEEIQWQLENVY